MSSDQEVNLKIKGQDAGAKAIIDDVRNSLNTMAVTAAAGVAGLVYALKQCISAYTDLQAATIGLTSTAKAYNIEGVDQMVLGLRAVRSGFISVADAAVAARNYIRMGMDLEQVRAQIENTTAVALTNRQAHLSLGEAVRSTADGFRMEMSQLADAGGITTNISVIYKEYAKTLGKTWQQLTQAEKAQAIFNETAKEAAMVSGNMDVAEQKLMGQQAKLGQSFYMVKVAIGEAFEPILVSVFKVVNSVFTSLRSFTEQFSVFVATIGASGGAVLVVFSLIAAFAKLQKTFQELDKVLSFSKLGLILTAIGVLVGVITALSTSSAKAKKDAEELNQKLDNTAKNAELLTARYKLLNSEIEIYKKQGKDTTALQKELNGVIQELGTYMAGSVSAWDSNNKAKQVNIKLLREDTDATLDNIRAQRQLRAELLSNQYAAAQTKYNAVKSSEKDFLDNLFWDLKSGKISKELQSLMPPDLLKVFRNSANAYAFRANLADWEKKTPNSQKTIDAVMRLYMNDLSNAVDKIKSQLDDILNEATFESVWAKFLDLASDPKTSKKALEDFVKKAWGHYINDLNTQSAYIQSRLRSMMETVGLPIPGSPDSNTSGGGDKSDEAKKKMDQELEDLKTLYTRKMRELGDNPDEAEIRAFWDWYIKALTTIRDKYKGVVDAIDTSRLNTDIEKAITDKGDALKKYADDADKAYYQQLMQEYELEKLNQDKDKDYAWQIAKLQIIQEKIKGRVNLEKESADLNQKIAEAQQKQREADLAARQQGFMDEFKAMQMLYEQGLLSAQEYYLWLIRHQDELNQLFKEGASELEDYNKALVNAELASERAQVEKILADYREKEHQAAMAELDKPSSALTVDQDYWKQWQNGAVPGPMQQLKGGAFFTQLAESIALFATPGASGAIDLTQSFMEAASQTKSYANIMKALQSILDPLLQILNYFLVPISVIIQVLAQILKPILEAYAKYMKQGALMFIWFVNKLIVLYNFLLGWLFGKLDKISKDIDNASEALNKFTNALNAPSGYIAEQYMYPIGVGERNTYEININGGKTEEDGRKAAKGFIDELERHERFKNLRKTGKSHGYST